MMDTTETTWRHGEEEYVYKFCSWDIAKQYVLDGSKTLRLNDIRSMNDPLEFTDFNINLYGVPRKFDPLPFWAAIHRATKDGVRYFCCSQDVISDFNEVTQFLTQPSIRGFDHPAMWNHYADQHEGVCLILRKKNLHTAIAAVAEAKHNILHGPVQYFRPGISSSFHKDIFPVPEGVEHWSDQEIQNYTSERAIAAGQLLFFSKTEEWTNEHEYRWVVLGAAEGPIDVPIRDALAGIVLGSDFDNCFHAVANKLANENSVPIRRVWWKNGSACPPWPPDAFDEGGKLEVWGRDAERRRSNRRT